MLAFWLGLYAFRAYVPAAVWNLSDELPLHLKPVFAVATHLIGLAGIAIVLKWRRRTLVPLTFAFAAVTVARQAFITADAIGPYLALAAWPLWLWMMAALADEVSAHDEDALVAPAFAIAVAMQLGLQSAWHGLDLASVPGPVALLASATLAGLFAITVSRIGPAELPRPRTSLVWLLVGPALFLELTLVGNAGRMSEMTGLSLLVMVIVLQLGLFTAVIAAEQWTRFAARVAIVAAGIAALLMMNTSERYLPLLVVVVQLVVVAGLREASERRLRMSAASSFAITGVLVFALVFGFYNAYELPPLWVVAYAPLAVAAALVQRARAWPAPQVITALAASTALATLYLVPPPPGPEAERNVLTVASYNIHHGFNDDGVPGMPATAREIENLNADVVALQEIGRGWTLLGGNDLVGYLRWRFPNYGVTYTPVNGELWGLAIMSRSPALAAGGGRFAAEPGAVRYGWTGVLVEFDNARFPFYSVHVTADLEGPMGDARLAQIDELQHLIRGKERVIVAGDFNAHPEDPPIKAMRTSLIDLGAVAGLAATNTWPAGQPNERIDYIFGKGMRVMAGAIPPSTASDHLPVVLRLRLGDTTGLR